MMKTPTRGVNPIRGEVWMVNFDPAVGDEIIKIRPAVVVNTPEVGRLELRIVAPLTGWREEFAEIDWFIRVPMTLANGLTKDSGADAFQVKCLSLRRFRRRLGVLTAEQMDDIAAAIAFCVGY